MKKTIVITLILVCFILLVPCIGLSEPANGLLHWVNCRSDKNEADEIEPDNIRERNELTLPSNLELIGEEAFEGTAFTNISIPESVEKIEDRAFAGIKQLFTVKISAETIIINDSAFDGNNNLVLSGFAGSAVKSWAESRGFRFILLEQFRRMDETGYFAFVPERKDYRKQLYLNYSELCDSEQIRVKQSTGRSCGELKASNYTGTASVYVQSRYFP